MSESPYVPRASYTIVQFGRCVQNTVSIEEPIEWYIIDEKQYCIKLLSKYVLDVNTFDGCMNRTIWKQTRLYDDLNNRFYMLNFSEDDRRIIEPHETCELNIDKMTLLDRTNISLLTKEEALQLHSSYLSTTLTKYALSKLSLNNKVDVPNTFSYWTQNVDENAKVSVVELNGKLKESKTASREVCGIRPTIWIDLRYAILFSHADISIIKKHVSSFSPEDFEGLL